MNGLPYGLSIRFRYRTPLESVKVVKEVDRNVLTSYRVGFLRHKISNCCLELTAKRHRKFSGANIINIRLSDVCYSQLDFGHQWVRKTAGLTFYAANRRTVCLIHSIKNVLVMGIKISPDGIIVRLQIQKDPGKHR